MALVAGAVAEAEAAGTDERQQRDVPMAGLGWMGVRCGAVRCLGVRCLE